MTKAEKQVLHDLLNAVENIAQGLDTMEAILNRKCLITKAEFDAQYPLHAADVEIISAPLRLAISNL
jgi:hypothetical protein